MLYIKEKNSDYYLAISELQKYKFLSIDVETYSNPIYLQWHNRLDATIKSGKRISFTDPYTNKVRLLQIATPANCFIFDILYLPDVIELKALLESPAVTSIGYNIKFDYKMLKVNCDINLANVFDCYLAVKLIANASGVSLIRTHGDGLKGILRQLYGIYLDKTQQVSNWAEPDLTIEQLQYAAEDVIHLHRLKETLEETISLPFGSGGYGMGKILIRENKLLPKVADMELKGVLLDLPLYKRLRQVAINRIPQIQYELAVRINQLKLAKDIQEGITEPESFIKFKVNLLGEFIILDSKLFSNPIKMKSLLNLIGLDVENTSKKVIQELLAVFKSSNDYINQEDNFTEDDEEEDLEAELNLIKFKQESNIYLMLKTFSELSILRKQIGTDYEIYINPVTGRVHSNFDQLGTSTGKHICPI